MFVILLSLTLFLFQLFKGTFYFCEGESIKGIKNKTECLSKHGNVWINRKYNFDDLGKALMSLFVLSSRDGWVNIMYTGLDAVGVDQQVSRQLID
jgi:voltage-dependent calcium channel T type alpha-1G